MTDVVFAFGPVDSFFFESQTIWRLKSLPPKLQVMFMAGSSDISHVYQLVLGAGDSWFISYRTKNGGSAFSHDGLPEKLASWLRIKDEFGYTARNIPKLKVSLGQGNASFWAEDGRDYYWDNLPVALMGAIQKLISPTGGWIRTPRIVVLGVHQSFVLVTEGGGGNYAVSNYYPVLQRELEVLVNSGVPGALKKIHHISLDQHDRDNFVMTTVTGDVYYHLPDSLDTDMKIVRRTIPHTPMGAIPETKQPEAMVARMPVPQAVSVVGVPDSGKGPESSRSPQPDTSGYVQVSTPAPGLMGMGHQIPTRRPVPGQQVQAPAPPYGAHVLNQVHQSPQPTPVQRYQSPSAPSQASATASTHPVPSAHSVHSSFTPAPPPQYQQQQQLQQRSMSPEAYQHPNVTALEHAAATTRVVSPVTVNTTGSLSSAPGLTHTSQQVSAPTSTLASQPPSATPQGVSSQLVKPSGGPGQYNVLQSQMPSPPLSPPEENPMDRNAGQLFNNPQHQSSTSSVHQYVQEQQRLYAASMEASKAGATINAGAGNLPSPAPSPISQTQSGTDDASSVLTKPAPELPPLSFSPTPGLPNPNQTPETASGLLSNSTANIAPAQHAWAPETTATPQASHQQQMRTGPLPVAAPAPPSPSDLAPELAAPVPQHAVPPSGQGPPGVAATSQVPQASSPSLSHTQQQFNQIPAHAGSGISTPSAHTPEPTIATASSLSYQQPPNGVQLVTQHRLSTPQHGAIPYMPPGASTGTGAVNASPPPLVHAYTTSVLPQMPQTTASVTQHHMSSSATSSLPPPASPSAIAPRHNSISGSSSKQFLSSFGKGFKNTLSKKAKAMVPRNGQAVGSLVAAGLLAGGLAEVTGRDPTTAAAGAMVSAAGRAGQQKQQQQQAVAQAQAQAQAQAKLEEVQAQLAALQAQHAAVLAGNGAGQHPGMAQSYDVQHGMQHGMQHAVQYGVQHGVQHGIQHVVQQGVQHGIQYGVQHGVQHGVQQGFQHGTQSTHVGMQSPVHSVASSQQQHVSTSPVHFQTQVQPQFHVQANNQVNVQTPVQFQGQTPSPGHQFSQFSSPSPYQPLGQYQHMSQSPPPPAQYGMQSPGVQANSNETHLHLDLQTQQAQQQQQQQQQQPQEQIVIQQDNSVSIQDNSSNVVQQQQQQQVNIDQSQSQSYDFANQIMSLQQQLGGATPDPNSAASPGGVVVDPSFVDPSINPGIDPGTLALLQAQNQLVALDLQSQQAQQAQQVQQAALEQQNTDALAALQAQSQMEQIGQENSLGLIDGSTYAYSDC